MPRSAAETEVITGFRDYFARVFEHDRWANGHVLETMASLGDRLPARPVARMGHLVVCQRLWLSRMTEDFERPDTIFPPWTLEETRSHAATIFARMRRFIDELPEEDFHRSFSFRTMEGEARSMLRLDILTQLSQHGPYHRGQIAVELNPLLPAPLTTDYVFHVWRAE